MTLVAIYNAGASGITDTSRREEFRLHTKPLRHVLRMLHRGVAVPLEWVEGETVGPYPRVTSVELVTYVFTKWMFEVTGTVMYSRSSLLERDRHRCAYCPKRGTTVDHILPRSRGGKTTWLNCVAACPGCNQRKDDRTPAEAGMRLRREPFVPTLAQIRPARRY